MYKNRALNSDYVTTAYVLRVHQFFRLIYLLPLVHYSDSITNVNFDLNYWNASGMKPRNFVVTRAAPWRVMFEKARFKEMQSLILQLL